MDKDPERGLSPSQSCPERLGQEWEQADHHDDTQYGWQVYPDELRENRRSLLPDEWRLK